MKATADTSTTLPAVSEAAKRLNVRLANGAPPKTWIRSSAGGALRDEVGGAVTVGGGWWGVGSQK